MRQPHTVILLIYLVLYTCLPVSAQVPLVKLSKSYAVPNEVCIAIDPANPSVMAAAANINVLYTSTDSGYTWHEQLQTCPLGIWGDPVIMFDDSGYLYYAHLSRTANKKFPAHLDRIVVQRSADGGKNFNDGIGVGAREDKVQDKEWLGFDGNKGSRFYGNLYMSWTEFDKYGSAVQTDRSRIRASVSHNRGLSFSEPVTVSDTTGDCLDSDNTMEGATTAIGSEGQVYIVWSGFGKLFFDRSDDGGKTFGKDRVIAQQHGGWDMNLAHMYRCNGMPFLTCDNTSGPHRGRIYLCWSDTRNGDADVWMMYSDSHGDTWSDPLRVNKDKEKNGRDQFMPFICVDAASGFVYLLYYDRRNSNTGGFLDTYLAVSKDGGSNFSEYRLSQSFPAVGKEVFFGDYITLAAYKGLIRPAWTVSLGKLQIFSATITQADLDAHAYKPLDIISRPFVLPGGKEWIFHCRVSVPGDNELRVYNGEKLIFTGTVDGFENEIPVTGKLLPGDYKAILFHGGQERSSTEFRNGP